VIVILLKKGIILISKIKVKRGKEVKIEVLILL